MDRRIRTRVVPVKEMKVFITGSRNPNRVIDYSVAGMAFEMNDYQILSGKRCNVDIMVGEELCACGLSGIVRWSRPGAVGITLTPRNDWQLKMAHHVETLAMMQDPLTS